MMNTMPSPVSGWTWAIQFPASDGVFTVAGLQKNRGGSSFSGRQ